MIVQNLLISFKLKFSNAKHTHNNNFVEIGGNIYIYSKIFNDTDLLIKLIELFLQQNQRYSKNFAKFFLYICIYFCMFCNKSES